MQKLKATYKVENGWWVAMIPEVDIEINARTLKQARSRVREAIVHLCLPEDPELEEVIPECQELE